MVLSSRLLNYQCTTQLFALSVWTFWVSYPSNQSFESAFGSCQTGFETYKLSRLTSKKPAWAQFKGQMSIVTAKQYHYRCYLPSCPLKHQTSVKCFSLGATPSHLIQWQCLSNRLVISSYQSCHHKLYNTCHSVGGALLP